MPNVNDIQESKVFISRYLHNLEIELLNYENINTFCNLMATAINLFEPIRKMSPSQETGMRLTDMKPIGFEADRMKS